LISLALQLFEGIHKNFRSGRSSLHLGESLLLTFGFLRPDWDSRFELSPADELLVALDSVDLHILKHGFNVTVLIVNSPESLEDARETSIFFLHFLVMTPALFGLSGLHELLHCFEDLVHPSEVLVEEVLVVELEEPVISLVFICIPVSFLHARGQRFCLLAPFLSPLGGAVRALGLFAV
jgi:hypothetical protein